MDFIVRIGGKLIPIQVTFPLEGTSDREVGNLARASKALRAEKSLIVTWEEEEKVERDGVKIEVVPLWRFLLYGFSRFLSST
ncbi:hypothetical protein [Thermococcus sp.]|uniref:hypothetical protein n=1 Tax=Thermococcus sp. TaxID=35749 RepID=UPI0026374197|nr:hypothetical protein [Thermococcus sp.]